MAADGSCETPLPGSRGCLVEDISIALARIPGFLVVSRNSAKRTEIPAGRLDELQDEVVREIVSRIEPELKRAELSTLRKRHAVDLGAWSLSRTLRGKSRRVDAARHQRRDDRRCPAMM